MKIPRCSKTITGKHEWLDKKWMVVGMEDKGVGTWYEKGKPIITILPVSLPKFGMVKIQPVCLYCGMVDDRKGK